MGHGVSTCATCDGFFFRGKPIAVVGGGDSALEEAIFLTRFASKVTVIHRRDALRASKIMQDKAFANPKIEFRWNAMVEEVKDVDERRGHRPRSCATLLTGDRSELCRWTACSWPSATRRTRRSSPASSRWMPTATWSRTTARRTNVPGVFACGDVQDHVYRQAITAAGSAAWRRSTPSGTWRRWRSAGAAIPAMARREQPTAWTCQPPAVRFDRSLSPDPPPPTTSSPS